MRNIILVIIFIFCINIILSIAFVTGGAFDAASIRSVYRSDPNILFFLDFSSSFYSIYSFIEAPSLIPRKISHFIIYGILSAVLFMITPMKNNWLRGATAIASSTFIGMIDEFHQYFLISRDGLFIDILINMAGSIIFVIALIKVMKFSQETD
ncbi:VanZ family protein [Salipaludibacillus daqingensis]|uniref:VanZ family protein n=1 Tax=Salipaludibacillus daqingensis TaxID=3041001 RepID=UPI0024736643|nr:VanZ family protein [Salipaludibacillus daqingensis]